MKNRLTDLNNLLFAQLERLANEDLAGESIETEIKRADAIVHVADKIISGAQLQLQAVKLVAEHGDKVKNRLPMIGAGDGPVNEPKS